MDDLEKKVRPIVPISNSEEQHLPIELFQNEVLRPILKLQHPILLALFHAFRSNFTMEWETLTNAKKKKEIANLLTKNAPLKHAIIGMIIGQMQEVEFATYLENRREYDRRISRMVVQRVQSTV